MIQVIENFITPEQELTILSQLRPSKVKWGFSRNKIIRFGSSLPYKARIKSKEIPDIFLNICKEIEKLGYELPDSVTVNEYMQSQSIDWHIDSLSSGPVIIVLSLLSDAEMGMRNQKTNENITQPLPARSLLILTEEHRLHWQHCIYPVHSHRFSVVFRKGTHVDV
jgi:alkylated DNA repair dioxygenase AlkB